MNKQRRDLLSSLLDQLESINQQLQTDLIEAEQAAFDNLPESFQDSEKGQRMTEIIDTLETASSSIQEAVDSIEEAIENR